MCIFEIYTIMVFLWYTRNIRINIHHCILLFLHSEGGIYFVGDCKKSMLPPYSCKFVNPLVVNDSFLFVTL